MARTDGRLALEFEYDAASSRTQLHVMEQRQPLKVVRAFHQEGGAALVHVHNVSGGVLCGDRLAMDLTVGPGAQAQITSTGATRVYRSRDDGVPAQFLTQVRLGENALLEYVPDSLIPFAGARYRQQTVIHMDSGASLFWWEIVAPGREARGELFSYHSLDLSFELRVMGVPVATERSNLDPLARPLSSVMRLGPYRYFSVFYICRQGIVETAWQSLQKQLLDVAERFSSPVIIWGLGRLPAHGLVVRALGQNSRDISRGLVAFWRIAKQALYGRDAVIPRKTY